MLLVVSEELVGYQVLRCKYVFVRALRAARSSPFLIRWRCTICRERRQPPDCRLIEGPLQ